MDVFLTGGTGFIGQALVRNARRRGWALRVLVRDLDAAPARWIARQGATLVRGDVTEPGGLAEAMRGCELMIHNAGVYEIGADAALARRMQVVNVQGTGHVLAAAHEAGVPRNLYVSTVWALGPSGRPPAAAEPRDENQRHDGRYLTPYEKSKALAHEEALRWRARGLPLVIAMPNAVVGANDHSVFGYFLRLVLLGRMAPLGWGRDAVYAPVQVQALAEGICRAAADAPMGEDYLICGPPMALGDLFALWGRLSGKRVPSIYLPRAVMRPQMALVEPLLRALDLPAFMSRDAVDASRAHLNYSSAKAQRELGWTHPEVEPMWREIIAQEQALMARRQGVRAKLRHVPVVEDAGTAAA